MGRLPFPGPFFSAGVLAPLAAVRLGEAALLDRGRGTVAVSTKHTLALTNRGGASTADLLALARQVRDGVEARFGIRLVNEPVLVGCAL
jgi:UDP-N-acetylmuramate dehydrogenase